MSIMGKAQYIRVVVLGLALAATACTRFQSLGVGTGTTGLGNLSSQAPGSTAPSPTNDTPSTPSTTPPATSPVVSAPAPSSPAPANPAPSGLDVSHADIDLTGFKLLFNDEFDAVSVAASNPKGAKTWYYLPPYGSAGYYSQSIWDAGAFSVINGILQNVLTLDSSNKWHSGNISSIDETGAGFATKYGYFEARAKMPAAGSGAWPAFWLGSNQGIPGLPGYGVNTEEIDIFEWYGVAKDQNQALMSQASHNWRGNGGGADETAPFLYKPGTPMPNGAKPWEGFHVYGCRVDPAHITWYIDGVQTNQIATPTAYMNGESYMMLDYAIGGGWPLSGLVNKSSFEVDWVRVYSVPQ